MKQFNDCEVGELFDTYQRANYAYIRKKGAKEEFNSVPFQEYKSYFTEFKNHIFLPIEETFYKWGFLRRSKKRETFFILDRMNFDDLVSMQFSIIEPIRELSNFEDFYKHTEPIRKSLIDLENAVDVPYTSNIKVKEQIKHITDLVHEISILLKQNEPK
ncbi:hypothetical protein U3A55_02370 [Salarchaeum sp. III]|uniref:hypothetical protein n=1 Tax=Salarchaeum sp. III TaxID=3107927 RepID=UPI002ED8191E